MLLWMAITYDFTSYFWSFVRSRCGAPHLSGLERKNGWLSGKLCYFQRPISTQSCQNVNAIAILLFNCRINYFFQISFLNYEYCIFLSTYSDSVGGLFFKSINPHKLNKSPVHSNTGFISRHINCLLISPSSPPQQSWKVRIWWMWTFCGLSLVEGHWTYAESFCLSKISKKKKISCLLSTTGL